MMEEIKIGDKVMVECRSGMGSGGPDKVTNITTEYDKVTGKPYRVVWCGTHGFYAEDGDACTPPWMYYISKKI